MNRWTPGAAARLGYLAGRGLSLESILADEQLCMRGEYSIRQAAARWKLAMGVGTPFTIFPSLNDRLRLQQEATSRGMSPRQLADRIVAVGLYDPRILDAAMAKQNNGR